VANNNRVGAHQQNGCEAAAAPVVATPPATPTEETQPILEMIKVEPKLPLSEIVAPVAGEKKKKNKKGNGSKVAPKPEPLARGGTPNTICVGPLSTIVVPPVTNSVPLRATSGYWTSGGSTSSSSGVESGFSSSSCASSYSSTAGGSGNGIVAGVQPSAPVPMSRPRGNSVSSNASGSSAVYSAGSGSPPSPPATFGSPGGSNLALNLFKYPPRKNSKGADLAVERLR